MGTKLNMVERHLSSEVPRFDPQSTQRDLEKPKLLNVQREDNALDVLV